MLLLWFFYLFLFFAHKCDEKDGIGHFFSICNFLLSWETALIFYYCLFSNFFLILESITSFCLNYYFRNWDFFLGDYYFLNSFLFPFLFVYTRFNHICYLPSFYRKYYFLLSYFYSSFLIVSFVPSLLYIFSLFVISIRSSSLF